MSGSPRKNSLLRIAFDSVGWPAVWGLAACAGFYLLISQQVIESPLVVRYFASHPVEYAATMLFFIGLMALIMKTIEVVGQFGTLSIIEVAQPPCDGQTVDDVPGMIDAITELPTYVRRSYLARRLYDALTHVRRRGSANGLNDQLKHLSDLDLARQHEGLALVRIIIWATPMLGFLGTVIGITLALGDLSPASLVNTPDKAMEGLLAGLSVAFDTTALALSLAIVLMFAQFLTNRLENELLDAVDTRVEADLLGRFVDEVHDSESTVGQVRRMSHDMLKATDDLVERQAQLWQSTIEDAKQQWQGISETTAQRLETGLVESLNRSVRDHAAALVTADQASGDRAERHWTQLQEALTHNAQIMQQQQTAMTQQGDQLLHLVRSIGDAADLQKSLDANLTTLSATGQFEGTLESLSAAINLLNARLGAASRAKTVVPFVSKANQEKAA